MKEYIPVIVAVISAVSVLLGYIFQKHKEREFEINKIRQDLYMRFVRNLSEKLDLLDKLRKDESVPERVTHEDAEQLMILIADKYPELDQNIKESIEIGALISLYASDEAIKACAAFSIQGWDYLKPDMSVLLHRLRKSLDKRSKVSVEDIRSITTK